MTVWIELRLIHLTVCNRTVCLTLIFINTMQLGKKMAHSKNCIHCTYDTAQKCFKNNQNPNTRPPMPASESDLFTYNIISATDAPLSLLPRYSASMDLQWRQRGRGYGSHTIVQRPHIRSPIRSLPLRHLPQTNPPSSATIA